MPQTTEAPTRSLARVAMPEGRLATSDPEIARFIDLEVERQRHGLELIASENFASPAVLEAMGTPLTNKYAEGLPGKRYYGGCEFVDMVEQLAIDRLKNLFDADHANVQAHSGAQANAAVYLAFLKPGDLVLGLDLSQGGLLLCEEGPARTVDKAMFPGTQGGPLEHIIAAKAVAFKEALEPSFKDYCGQIVRNAQTLANALIERGFNLVSGGTDNHLMLVDLRNKNVTGKVAEKALDAAGITVNKNTVPKETQSPFVTSGIRIGTPAVTTRGMREREMQQIADLIDKVIASSGDPAVASSVKEEVLDLTNRFPLYKSFPSMADAK